MCCRGVYPWASSLSSLSILLILFPFMEEWSAALFWGHSGDPMGSLLFGLTIHQLSAKMRPEFAVFYLDDGTPGGNKEDAIHDIKNIEVEAEALGLILNKKKTELICKDPTSRGFVLGALPGVCIFPPRGCQPCGLSYRRLTVGWWMFKREDRAAMFDGW